MERGVHVAGNDVRDAAQMLHSNDRHQPWLTVQPIEDHSMDRRLDRAPPTTKFMVRWSGGAESFTRQVNNLKELYEVLRPIFQACRQSEKKLDAQLAKNKAEYQREVKQRLQMTVASARAQLSRAEEELEKFHEQS